MELTDDDEVRKAYIEYTLIQGLSTRDIAKTLGVTQKTWIRKAHSAIGSECFDQSYTATFRDMWKIYPEHRAWLRANALKLLGAGGTKWGHSENLKYYADLEILEEQGKVVRKIC